MRVTKLASSLAIFALLAGCTSTNADTIVIGFVGPLTGDAASYGVDMMHGAQLKIDEINAAGGIDGKMVTLVAEDGKCNPSDATASIRKLLTVDHPVVILGGVCSGETLAMAPIAEDVETILLSPGSSSPDITDAGTYTFRVYPSDALRTKVMASFMQQKKYKRIAILSENTDYAIGFRDSLRRDIGNNMEIVFDESVEPGTKDYRSLITRLKDAKADIFVANGQYPASVAAMLQQMREQGITMPAITQDVGQTVETITLAGDASEGLMAINPPSVGADSPFGKLLTQQYGGAQGAIAYAAFAYDAAGVLINAITEVGTDGPLLREYLLDLPSYDGVVGSISFDENGDVVGVPYKLLEVKNGAWVETADAPMPQ